MTDVLKIIVGKLSLNIDIYRLVGTELKCQCYPHIETSQLICCANKLTGFYMRATLAFNGLTGLKKIKVFWD